MNSILAEDLLTELKIGYQFKGINIPLGLGMLGDNYLNDAVVRLPLGSLNRHGLITGATGTGKTKTLQMLAEQLSRNGIPSLLMDLKGDLSGIAAVGEVNSKIEERKILLGVNYPFNYEAFPVNFLSLGQDFGISLKATIDSFGSVLLSRVLHLNHVQSGIISIVFKYCADNNLLINNIEDLKFILTKICKDNNDLQNEYGNVAQSSVATILRNIAELEEQGGNHFIGNPSFDINDLILCDEKGKGILSIIRLTKIQDKPALFSTFILYLLTKLYNSLPEVGDLPKPKMVMFIDEAHLLFNETNKTVEEKLESIIKLIRSKGVGIIFCTQAPTDISEAVLGQLGLKIQHALRAFTPNDRKAIKLMSNNFPITNHYKLESELTTLGIGEAFITVLNEKGIPSPVVKTMLSPPVSRMNVLTDLELTNLVNKSALINKYGLNNHLPITHSKELESFYKKILNKQEAEKNKQTIDKLKEKKQIVSKKNIPTKSSKKNTVFEMFSNLIGVTSSQNTQNSNLNLVQYYFSTNGQSFGPYSYEDICKMLSTNQLNKEMYLWKTGMPHWLTIDKFTEF